MGVKNINSDPPSGMAWGKPWLHWKNQELINLYLAFNTEKTFLPLAELKGKFDHDCRFSFGNFF